jgi:light-regulated signal transduction histidine kinase (bacteriophytochrome)
LLVNKAEFEQTDLTKLFTGFLDEMHGQDNEKNPMVLIEPLPTLRVNHLLMRPLFRNLVRDAIVNSNDTKPVIKFWSEVGGLKEPSATKNSSNMKYHNIIVENKNVINNIKGPTNAEQAPVNGERKGSENGPTLVKKIMEKHDGFLLVRNKTDDETVYVLSFPVAP